MIYKIKKKLLFFFIKFFKRLYFICKKFIRKLLFTFKRFFYKLGIFFENIYITITIYILKFLIFFKEKFPNCSCFFDQVFCYTVNSFLNLFILYDKIFIRIAYFFAKKHPILLSFIRGCIIICVWFVVMFIRLIYLGPKLIYYGVYLIYVTIWVLFGPDFARSPSVFVFKLFEWPCFAYFEFDRRNHFKDYYNVLPEKFEKAKVYNNYYITWWKHHGEQMFTITLNLLREEIDRRKLYHYKEFEKQYFEPAILALVNYFLLMHHSKFRRPCFDVFIDSKIIVHFLLKCDLKRINEVAGLYRDIRLTALVYDNFEVTYLALQIFHEDVTLALQESFSFDYNKRNKNNFKILKRNNKYFYFYYYKIFEEVFLKFMNEKVFPFSPWYRTKRNFDYCGWIDDLDYYSLEERKRFYPWTIRNCGYTLADHLLKVRKKKINIKLTLKNIRAALYKKIKGLKSGKKVKMDKRYFFYCPKGKNVIRKIDLRIYKVSFV